MEVPPPPPLSRDIAGAMAWWRDAGVDCDFANEATVWLSPEQETAPAANPQSLKPTPVIKSPVAPERPRFGGDKATWPQDLASFKPWWLEEPSLDQGSSAQRIAPRGPHGADLMILVEQPEAADHESLLSGPNGQMVSAMLAAMGVPAQNVYFASLLTRHTPMPDWQGLRDAGLGAVLSHHLALAAPQRIIAFGSNIPAFLRSPLAENDPAQSPATGVKIGDSDQTTPLFCALSLDALHRARAKAGLWQRWLDWSGPSAA